MVLISSSAWMALQEGLYKKFSSGASVIIQEMGNQIGIMVFKSLKNLKDVESESRTINAQVLSQVMFSLAGGKVDISGDVETGSNVCFVIRNCAFCDGEKAEEYKCYFIRGMVTGFSSETYQKEYKSTVNCLQGENGHLCTILLVGR